MVVRPNLCLGTGSSSAGKGAHQGDPMAGLFFAVVLHVIIRMVSVEVPNLLLQGWFLDDGDMVGNREDLIKVVQILLREGPSRGLIIST